MNWNLFSASRDDKSDNNLDNEPQQNYVEEKINSKTQPEQEQQEKQEVLDECSAITFSLENGKLNIECKWHTKNDINTALEFGVLLSQINLGMYADEIIDILKEYAVNNPNDKDFILNILDAWIVSSKTNAHEPLDEIVIHPLKTFGASRFLHE